MRPHYWNENYIMVHSIPMGLAAGKAEISMHLMNYMKQDLAAITVTIQDWWLVPRMDHGIITFLWFCYVNNLIQSNLILILEQTQAVDVNTVHLVLHPDKIQCNPGLVLDVWTREKKKTPPAEQVFWPVAMPCSRQKMMGTCIWVNAVINDNNKCEQETSLISLMNTRVYLSAPHG